MSVPSDSNISPTAFEKLSKYNKIPLNINCLDVENKNKNHTSYCRCTWYDEKGSTKINKLMKC